MADLGVSHLRRVARGFESHENRRNERGMLSSVTRPSVFLIRREKERHLARLHTPRSRGDVTGGSPPTPGRTPVYLASIPDVKFTAAGANREIEKGEYGTLRFI